MPNTKLTHGGARKGAGRKPSPVRHKRINIYLSEHEIELIKKIDDSPTQAIRTMLEMIFGKRN